MVNPLTAVIIATSAQEDRFPLVASAVASTGPASPARAALGTFFVKDGFDEKRRQKARAVEEGLAAVRTVDPAAGLTPDQKKQYPELARAVESSPSIEARLKDTAGEIRAERDLLVAAAVDALAKGITSGTQFTEATVKKDYPVIYKALKDPHFKTEASKIMK